MRYTPESYDARVRAWEDAEGSPETFPHRTAEELEQRRIGDAERIACQLLYKAPTWHPVLNMWIQSLLTDPVCVSALPDPETVTAETWQKYLISRGMDEGISVLKALDHAWGLRGEGCWGVKKGYRVELTYPASTPALHKLLDETTRHLAWALLSHRQRGEDGEDSVHALGFGLAVTSSLAAGICEYHEAVANIYANALQEAHDALQEERENDE